MDESSHTPDVMSTLEKYSDTPLDQPKPLVQASDEHQFWLVDGRALRNLRDLKAAFETMTQEQFDHHVTTEKNDFASWVRYVLLDEDCARDLQRCKKPLSAKRIVIKYLKLYQ
jgi:hypothetical protein